MNSYLYWSGSIAAWSVGYAVTLSGLFSKDTTLFWNRTCHAFASIIPVAFFHLACAVGRITSKKAKMLLAFGYANAAVLIALSPTKLFVADLWQMSIFTYQPLGGPAYLYFTSFFMIYTSYSLILLLLKIRECSGNEREQIRTFFIGSCVAYTGGSTLFFQGFRISVDPIGVFFVSSHVLFTGYAIYKYQFMNIEIIVRRATVFAGLFAFVYSVFSVFTIIGQRLFENYFGANLWISMLPTIFIITIALRPLDTILTAATEKYLFQKKYDYKHLLKTFTSEVLTVLDLQPLLDKTAAGLTSIIKLESCAIFIHNPSTNQYEIKAHVGLNDGLVLSNNSGVVYYLNARQDALCNDDSLKKMPNASALIAEFKSLRASLLIPILLNEKMIGVMCLGEKKSGENYTSEDIDILISLARTEAIAISNAQLFQELSKTQAEAAQREKMAVIGTLAAGINHEICNPLGIARGQCEMFLLNYRDGLYKDVPQKELVEKCVVIYEKVIGEIDRATGITKRLSSFAKPSKKFEFSEIKVAECVKEVLAILAYELRLDNIHVETHIPSDLSKILVDKKQIEEIIFNIIRNAAQAIAGKGSITIRAHDKDERVYLEIEDTGHGIPADKINEIFNPFYTTKAPGKGTGLGLFIVKQVVERNKGTISVQSQVGVGTKFTLSFETPAKQLAAAA